MIYTIGYAKTPIEELVAIMAKYHITALVDVRSSPFSAFHKDYNTNAIQQKLTELGSYATYIFLGKELGAKPANPALYKDGEIDFAALISSADFKCGIRKVETLQKYNESIALLCCESDPAKCHRAIIATELIEHGLQASHLHSGRIESHSELLKRQQLAKPSPTLFDLLSET